MADGTPEAASRVDRILDYAARRGSWPAAAGIAFGFGGLWTWQGSPVGLPVFAVGLIMTLISPVGTTLRRQRIIRQARRLIAAQKKRDLN